ncbi:hypothetical protein GCM10023237_03300 [Streptomyces coeruleoprunus]
MARQVADRQQRVAVRQFQRVVPVAADPVAAERRQVVPRQVQRARPVVREAQRTAPRRQHRLLQLHRHPVLRLLDGLPAAQRVTGLAHRALAPAQFADVA